MLPNTAGTCGGVTIAIDAKAVRFDAKPLQWGTIRATAIEVSTPAIGVVVDVIRAASVQQAKVLVGSAGRSTECDGARFTGDVVDANP